ncbi:hypothetical protein INT43_004266 [Umbelopsis isabellina]|uniref:Uncharacterized protein n=1 Tax=Mortierella isabellina TaxID=91625 RepID=A0A8H7U950_MORIS|nr:hypothetical protein INT43_004266 [Umbelopsis isabellina]
MSLLTLRQELALLFDNYFIPATMLDHGLVLLEKVIDIEGSTESFLKLKPNAGWHSINPSMRCLNMVYFLVKELDGSSGDQLMRGSHINVGPSTRLYAGQTMDFRRRESHRHGHQMAQSHTLMTKVKHPSSIVHGTHTIGLVSRVLIVSTAPPITKLNNPDYQGILQVWINQVAQGVPISNPPVDVMAESDTSPNMRFLRDLVQEDPIDPDQGPDLMQIEPGYIPDFIDLYPDEESDNYRGLARAVSVEQIRRADRNVPSKYPTAKQRCYSYARRTPYISVSAPSEASLLCGDVGLCSGGLILVYEAHKLHLLLWKLKRERPYPFGPFTEGSYGVTEEQGYAIIDWVMENDTLTALFPERLQQELPEMTLAEVSRTWSASTTSRLTMSVFNELPTTMA